MKGLNETSSKRHNSNEKLIILNRLFQTKDRISMTHLSLN